MIGDYMSIDKFVNYCAEGVFEFCNQAEHAEESSVTAAIYACKKARQNYERTKKDFHTTRNALQLTALLDHWPHEYMAGDTMHISDGRVERWPVQVRCD